MSEKSISAQIAHAFNRFGFGGRPDDAIPTDPVAWLTNQLTGTDPLANAAPTLATCLGLANSVMVAPLHSAQRAKAVAAVLHRFAADQTEAVQIAVTTATPFRERLVWFWANHFSIVTGNPTTMALASAFVREAIRPYVTDSFSNMLLAVMQHPAMLCALNNDVSIGPQSPLALRQGSGGINENLARETLELFTVGLGANFTQPDVDALAYILTGWTVSYSGLSQGFVVDSDMHQPGSQTLLGVTYSGTIFDGYQALQYLGTHAQTYTHIATKLVQHFTSDTPDPADIAIVNQALSSSGGNLGAAAIAITGLSNAWIPQTKLRVPTDFVVAALRAVNATTGHIGSAAQDAHDLGQPIWGTPFPNGWSDLGADWAAASQMMLRTNWANGFCNRYRLTDPNITTDIALGGLITPAAIAMLARVSATHDKLTILFCSPDFQRR